MTDHQAATGRASGLTWAAGLVVAAGAGVATAHGLFQVAAAAGVPAGVAWLYPLITDGLALVAYAATARLHQSRARRYAAGIVVLADGLSGLAQAVYLAGAIHRGHTAPVGLRYGVGAWPALAAAIAAHLLHLVHPHAVQTAAGAASSNSASSNVASNPGPSNDAASNWTGNASNPTASDAASNPGVQPRPTDERPTAPDRPDEPERVDAAQPEMDDEPPAAEAGSARDRARAAAMGYRDRHGTLPTVAELAEITGASHGTAGNALKDVRDAHPALHLISTKPSNDTTKTTNS